MGRGHDVGEQHRLHRHIGVDAAGQNIELGMGDVLDQVAARPQVDETALLTMEDQGGGRDGRQKGTYIRLDEFPGPGVLFLSSKVVASATAGICS
jgi:hypothetical protein